MAESKPPVSRQIGPLTRYRAQAGAIILRALDLRRYRSATTTDEFEVEIFESGFITVRHTAEGHRYTFDVGVDDLSALILRGVAMRENQKARHGANAHAAAARTFAERQAKKAGLID